MKKYDIVEVGRSDKCYGNLDPIQLKVISYYGNLDPIQLVEKALEIAREAGYKTTTQLTNHSLETDKVIRLDHGFLIIIPPPEPKEDEQVRLIPNHLLRMAEKVAERLARGETELYEDWAKRLANELSKLTD